MSFMEEQHKRDREAAEARQKQLDDWKKDPPRKITQASVLEMNPQAQKDAGASSNADSHYWAAYCHALLAQALGEGNAISTRTYADDPEIHRAIRNAELDPEIRGDNVAQEAFTRELVRLARENGKTIEDEQAARGNPRSEDTVKDLSDPEAIRPKSDHSWAHLHTNNPDILNPNSPARKASAPRAANEREFAGFRAAGRAWKIIAKRIPTLEARLMSSSPVFGTPSFKAECDRMEKKL